MSVPLNEPVSEPLPHDHNHPTVDTVEAVVRRRMAAALGGKRGMIEAGVPGLVFTVLWLTTKEPMVAVIGSAAAAIVFLVVRVVQKTTLQYVGNAIFGIVIGFGIVKLAGSLGGTAEEQALAYFLPGILISLGYSILMGFTCLIGWPVFGFLIGSVSGDPTAWHDDKQIVALCTRLTWLFLAPGAIGVLLQGPVLFLGWHHIIHPDLAIVILTVLRTGLGWALRIACYGVMIWLLARNHTPVNGTAEKPETA